MSPLSLPRTFRFALPVALAALGLGACQKQREQAASPPQEKIFVGPEGTSEDGGTAAPAFTRITVQSQGQTTVLERHGSAWRITAPVSARADPWTVDNLTRQLQSAKFKSTVAEAPTEAELRKYGLLPPVFSVTAQDPDRQQTVTLEGGLENPFDGSVYVRREGDPRVHAAEGSVRYALDKDLYALREKEFLGVEVPALKTLTVTAKAGGYTLEQDADKAWRFTKPSPLRADAAKVKKMLQSLREQRALAFPPDTAEERRRRGLDTPLVEAVLSLQDGETVRVRLSRVEGPEGAQVFALREQGPEAFLAQVPEAAAAVLTPGIAALRDTTVLSFRREDVKRLVFHGGPGVPPLTLEKTGSGTGPLEAWRVVSPQPGKARTATVAGLFKLLGTLKAAAVGTPAPKGWAAYGITPASRGATLLDANGRELARLSVGNEVPGSSEHVYARGSDDALLEVEQTRLADLPSRPEDVLEAPPTAPP
jgi:hypothetical protein